MEVAAQSGPGSERQPAAVEADLRGKRRGAGTPLRSILELSPALAAISADQEPLAVESLPQMLIAFNVSDVTTQQSCPWMSYTMLLPHAAFAKKTYMSHVLKADATQSCSRSGP